MHSIGEIGIMAPIFKGRAEVGELDVESYVMTFFMNANRNFLEKAAQIVKMFF